MGSIAFLPWVHFDKDFSIGKFDFLRSDQKNNPLISLPKPFDQIIQVTRSKNNSSISQFMIVRKQGGTLVDNWTDGEIDELYVVVELLSLVAISTRNITGHDYVNTDNLQLIVQRFDQIPIQHLSTRSRRRGSSLWEGYNINFFRTRCPEHVSPGRDYKIDVQFLNALSAFVVNNNPGWKRVLDAVENFNLANTDYVRIRENSEFVLLSGAFERLLDSNGKAQTFRYKVAKELDFVPKQALKECKKSIPKSKCSIRKCAARLTRGRWFVKNAFDTCKTLRDFWAIDFYRMRNTFAHGERAKNDTIWTAQEHLTLSSHLFPLLVKLYLRKQRAFSLRAFEDNRHLFQFDFFLIRNDLLVEDTNLITGWEKAKQEAALNSTASFPIV